MSYAIVNHEAVRDQKLSPVTFRVLCYLALRANGNPVTFTEIASELFININGMHTHISRLTKAGYIAQIKWTPPEDTPYAHDIEKPRRFVVLCGGMSV